MARANPSSPLPARRYAKLQLQFDRRLNAILERAARDIRVRVARMPLGVGGDIRRAQLNLVLNEIRNVQQVMWNQGVLDTVISGKGRAALAAQSATETLERVLYASLPESVADVVRGGLRATALAGIERDVARVPRALSARVYKDFALTSGQVEATIRSGIISGLSARELAQSVYQYISPLTPGGASYAASRLARTEINNSFHEMQIKGGQRPGVLGVVWNLSGSHGKPDDCNTFASQNSDDLGQGVYKPDNVPGKPHPQCLCYMTYKTMDGAQFEKALKSGKFNDDLDARINANLRRLGRGEKPTPTLSGPDTKRIDHSTHDHPKTTAARQACKKRLESVFDPLPKVPDVPKAIKAPPSTTPKLDKLPRNSHHQRGEKENFQSIARQANGSVRRRINDHVAYGTNCQQVVQAAELRARGFDVMAKARRKDYSNNIVGDGWTYSSGMKPVTRFDTDLAHIQNTILSTYKEGERAWVMCLWKKGGGHIFNVGIEDGRVVWYDAQIQTVLSRDRIGSISRTMGEYDDRVQDQFGWGIIEHTERLIPDDDVLRNVEPFKAS